MNKTINNQQYQNSLIITCAGSQVIPEIINLLRSYNGIDFNIVGVDVKKRELSIGSYFSDKFYQVPKGTDDNYIDAIIDIIKRENVFLILPGSDEEVLVLSKYKEKLKNNYNCNICSSDYLTTMTLINKYKMLVELSSNSLNTGKYSLINNSQDIYEFAEKIDYPNNNFIIKPMEGSGSKGLKIVREDINLLDSFYSSKNFNIELKQLINFLDAHPEEYKKLFLMEYFPGDKFSSDILVSNNETRCVITRNNGPLPKTNPPTQIADLVTLDKIDKYINQLLKLFDIDYFVQIELGLDKNENLAFIESNPRLDATLPITLGYGVNYYHQIIKYAIDGDMDKNIRLKNNKKIRYYRYWQSHFEEV